MSTEAVSSAVLQFSSTYAYPESEELVTAELTPATLTNVLTSLQKQRDDLKEEVRTLSKTNGPNVETWIDQAKRLQTDIQKSREIARQIVDQHEVGQKLKAETGDTQNKIGLLEREITFEKSLETALCQVKDLNILLSSTQEDVVQNKLESAHATLRTAKDAFTKLGSLRDSRCVVLLRDKGKRLQTSLEEALEQHWSSILVVDAKQSSFNIESQATSSHTDLDTIVKLAEDLGLLDQLVQKLSRQIERIVLKPLFGRGNKRVSVSETSLHITQGQADYRLDERLDDLRTVLAYIHRRTGELLSSKIFANLLPKTLSQVEEAWLEPAIPTDISEIKPFEASIASVSSFTEFVHTQGFGDATALQIWLKTLPKAWITKRRETLLSEARNIVFKRIHETKTVERVESQMVSKDDAMAAQVNGGDDDWDKAWDDNDAEQQSEPTSAPKPALMAEDEDEDDGSAWDVDETSEPQHEEQDGTEDAWGWGDDHHDTASTAKDTHTHPASPRATKRMQREVTFKETYTVTQVPDEILRLIQDVIADAQRLATVEFANSSLAPAAAGLYSLPTLALAIYRATATTAYAKLATGNMLIYNDATRLSERLRDWQSAQPPASRLRLDNDAKALDLFAKRAYSVEMESQKTVLRDILDGAQGFSNCITPPFKQECESAVEQAADRLTEVFRQWKVILGDNALLQSLGQLLSGATGKMISEIEDLSDIGEEDSKQLKALCERLSVVKALFAQQQPSGELRDMTFVYCPNWLKFQYLAEILESSLADIKFLWTEGELSLEFSSEEVIDLIMALFAESDHRRKLVGELRRQSRR